VRRLIKSSLWSRLLLFASDCFRILALASSAGHLSRYLAKTTALFIVLDPVYGAGGYSSHGGSLPKRREFISEFGSMNFGPTTSLRVSNFLKYGTIQKVVKPVWRILHCCLICEARAIRFEALRVFAHISYFSESHVEEIMELDRFLSIARAELRVSVDSVEPIFTILTNACFFTGDHYEKVLLRKGFVQFALNSVLCDSVKVQIAVAGFLSANPKFAAPTIRTKRFGLWISMICDSPFELRSELLWLMINIIGIVSHEDCKAILCSPFADAAFDFLESPSDEIVQEAIMRCFTGFIRESPEIIAYLLQDEEHCEILGRIVLEDENSVIVEAASSLLSLVGDPSDIS
jgi:hypothetical protein